MIKCINRVKVGLVAACSAGRIIEYTFIKRDGTTRTLKGIFQLDVDLNAAATLGGTMMQVWDVEKSAHRNVNLQNLITMELAGITFIIVDGDV